MPFRQIHIEESRYCFGNMLYSCLLIFKSNDFKFFPSSILFTHQSNPKYLTKINITYISMKKKNKKIIFHTWKWVKFSEWSASKKAIQIKCVSSLEILKRMRTKCQNGKRKTKFSKTIQLFDQIVRFKRNILRYEW